MPARGEQSTEGRAGPPLVCMYLFLDAAGATLPPHPSPRTASPLRYLECALVQAASLRLAGASCETVLLTNMRGGPGREGRRMRGALGELGVEVRDIALRIEPGTPVGATRLPREAIRAAADGLDGARELWVPNLDCVWIDPERALRACPRGGRVGALAIPYPPDWAVGGPAAVGATREDLGRTAAGMGARLESAPPWIGADLLAGSARALLGLLAACDELDTELAARGATATNEQLLTPVGRARARRCRGPLPPRAAHPDRGAPQRRRAVRRRRAGDLASAGGEGAQPAPRRTGPRARPRRAAARRPRLACARDAPFQRRPGAARPPAAGRHLGGAGQARRRPPPARSRYAARERPRGRREDGLEVRARVACRCRLARDRVARHADARRRPVRIHAARGRRAGDYLQRRVRADARAAQRSRRPGT